MIRLFFVWIYSKMSSIPMSTYRCDYKLVRILDNLFLGHWFIGYGPMMPILVSEFQEGETIRENHRCNWNYAPIITTFLFTIF